MRILPRLLEVRLSARQSAFLWGPRRVGKTYWLREQFAKPGDTVLDLLKTDVFADYATRPALLRERWNGSRTIIDEVQKIPALLDEVHWLIENRGAQFLLTGSSARKLRRGHANLLAGRARRYEMGPLSSLEVEGFSLNHALRSGLIPAHLLSDDPGADLRTYVSDYLAEEIAAEAATRNIPAFAEFLRVAALTNAELLNYTNVAREAGTSAKVVRGYFELLEDTLLGERLGPWTKARDRRMILTEKFYFFDVGIAGHLARRHPEPGNSDFGKAFEHFIWMELRNYQRYREPDLPIAFWRTASGLEIDFVLGEMSAAIEVKASHRVHSGDLRGLHALLEERKVGHALVASLESAPRRVGRIEILPWQELVRRLWAGDLA